MNIEIKIEIDKEFTELIQSKFDKIAEKIISFAGVFEKLTILTKDTDCREKADDQTTSQTENSYEAAPLHTEEHSRNRKTNRNQITKRKKKTALNIVFGTIRKNNSGINVDNLKRETGFDSRKIADAVYRLKKDGKIRKTDEGFYVALH